MLAEVVMVMLAAMALAAALAALTNSFGRPLLKAIIL
jgi:hypothetical protein